MMRFKTMKYKKFVLVYCETSGYLSELALFITEYKHADASPSIGNLK